MSRTPFPILCTSPHLSGDKRSVLAEYGVIRPYYPGKGSVDIVQVTLAVYPYEIQSLDRPMYVRLDGSERKIKFHAAFFTLDESELEAMAETTSMPDILKHVHKVMSPDEIESSRCVTIYGNVKTSEAGGARLTIKRTIQELREAAIRAEKKAAFIRSAIPMDD